MHWSHLGCRLSILVQTISFTDLLYQNDLWEMGRNYSPTDLYRTIVQKYLSSNGRVCWGGGEGNILQCFVCLHKHNNEHE
jgi:hypothetical protein